MLPNPPIILVNALTGKAGIRSSFTGFPAYRDLPKILTVRCSIMATRRSNAPNVPEHIRWQKAIDCVGADIFRIWRFLVVEPQRGLILALTERQDRRFISISQRVRVGWLN